MANVILRQKAIDDLNDIWDYTFEQWSEHQADTYYTAIRDAFREMGENPQVGKEYTEIGKNLFGIKSGRHIIFYRLPANKEIEVIRILYERMDLKNRLGE
jgi:toxin ParE1/3/4